MNLEGGKNDVANLNLPRCSSTCLIGKVAAGFSSSPCPRQTCTQGTTPLFRPSVQQPPLTTREVKPLSLTVIRRERQREGEKAKWTYRGEISRERGRVKIKGTYRREVEGEEMRIQMNLLHPTDTLSSSVCVHVCECVSVLPTNWNAMRCETPL